MQFKINSLILLFVLYSTSLFGQYISIKVGNVYPGELDMGGFHLSENSIIEIDGLGASFDEWDSYLEYYGWILETSTRKVVWRSENCEDYSKSDGEYDIEKELNLKAGDYEIYFAAGARADKYLSRGLGAIYGVINGHKSDVDEFRKEYYIKIVGEEGTFELRDPFELVNNRNRDAVVSITRVGDSESIVKKFSTTKEITVSVYGIGEGVKKQFYDFGFIYDVSKNKKVWMFNRDDAIRAGGGSKNVAQKAVVTLPKGSYSVQYKSDDTHSFDEWNVKPPDDPQYWGIVVTLNNEEDRKSIVPFNKDDIIEPVVDLTKIEEDEFVSMGISLRKNLKIRVLAIGEGYRDLADYGWIIDADTKEVVWKMSRKNTEYAGGAKKNRMVDEVIQLKKGNYIVNYTTDDSHNYGDWNATPPFEEDKWGITIWTLNKKDQKYISTFNASKYKSKNLIAEIVKVEDDENLTKSFTLKKRADIRIIAIGERGGNDLADYAWITDSDGDIVWKMKLKETSHAGGASKNRLFDDVIELEAGRYKLHYKTDDSHSFEEWNSSPPDNPQMYGVTLLYDK